MVVFVVDYNITSSQVDIGTLYDLSIDCFACTLEAPPPVYAPVFQVASKRTKLPTGRILNRFSKDIDIIDTTVPMNVRQLFNQLLTVLGTVVAVVFAMPIFIVIVIPVAFLYY